MKKRREFPNIAFLDLLWNALLGFIILFTLAFIQMNLSAKAAEKRIETAGQFVVLVTWPDQSQDDVDTYVMDPQGNIVFFRNRERGLMHLERDDLGGVNDVIIQNGQRIQIAKNEERVIIRGVIPGEYIVNVHMFNKRHYGSTKVKVVLVKLGGEDIGVIEKEVVLGQNGDEITVFRFTLDAEGGVLNINDLQRKLTRLIGGP